MYSSLDGKFKREREYATKIKLSNLKILKNNPKKSYWLKVISALSYGGSSFLFTVVNKIVLTSCGFPSPLFLALVHLTITSIILWVLKKQELIQCPDFNRNTFKNIFPLPILFLGNVVTSLDGTKELSLPMFTALRRFAIFLTMVFEFLILRVKPKLSVQFAVYTMIAGSLLAALNDVTFHLFGYLVIMSNNFCAASSKVITKQKLDLEQFESCGLLFYNAISMLIPLFLFSVISDDLRQAIVYERWGDKYFMMSFCASCVLAFPVNLSLILCTGYNSALTTATVGCLKDILVTQVGRLVGGDYVYSFYNSLGLNLGAGGSLLYIFLTFGASSQGGLNPKGRMSKV